MIYMHSSALMKLIRSDAESVALRDWLRSEPETPVVTSELGRVDVFRAARRAGSRALIEARAIVEDVDLVPLDRAVRDLAAELEDPQLRTLDALHLATAILLGENLTAFVVYDQHLASAARGVGLPTLVPT